MTARFGEDLVLSAKTQPSRGSYIYLILRVQIGTGEGIRTLDPNLGKVRIILRPTTLRLSISL